MSSKRLSVICILWMLRTRSWHSFWPLQLGSAVWWMMTLWAELFSFSFCLGADAPHWALDTMLTVETIKSIQHKKLPMWKKMEIYLAGNIMTRSAVFVFIPFCSIFLCSFPQCWWLSSTPCSGLFQPAGVGRCGRGKYTVFVLVACGCTRHLNRQTCWPTHSPRLCNVSFGIYVS